MTYYTSHVTGGEHCVEISGPELKWFEIYDVLKILRKRMTQSISSLISDGGVYGTAPATLGLLITLRWVKNRAVYGSFKWSTVSMRINLYS